MSQQDVSGVPTEQWNRPAQPTNDGTWKHIQAGVYLIAWFVMFEVFYSLTLSVISLMDTDYNLDGWARLFIGAGVAALLSFFIAAMARAGQS